MFLPPDEPSGLDRRAARLAGAVAGAHALRRGGATRRAHARGGVRHGRLIRAVFPHPVDVGGRYAALTVVGMVPAALIGVDGRTLLERAQAVQPDRAKALGARLAAAVQARRDKLVLRPPPRIARLAD